MFTTGAPLIRDEGLFLTASYSGLVTWDWALMLYDVQTQLLSIKVHSFFSESIDLSPIRIGGLFDWCMSLSLLDISSSTTGNMGGLVCHCLFCHIHFMRFRTLFCTVIMAAVVLDPNETVIYLARLLVVPFNNVVSVIAVTVTTAAICVQIIPVVIYGAMNIHRKLIGKCDCQRHVTDSQSD